MALACLHATTPTPTCINLMARLAGVGEYTWKTVPHFLTNLDSIKTKMEGNKQKNQKMDNIEQVMVNKDL